MRPVRRISDAESCVLDVQLWSVRYKYLYAVYMAQEEGGGARQERKAGATHSVHDLVTPSARWTEVALTPNGLSTTTPVCLVLEIKLPGAADPLNLSAVVIVWHRQERPPFSTSM